MKQILFILLLTGLAACNTVEHGATDNIILSRKLFDTMRSNDFEQASALFPDKGTFRKLEEQNEKEIEDLDAAYDRYVIAAKEQFDAIILTNNTWETSKYSHTSVETVRLGNVPTAKITVKFDSANGPNKFSFTSIKFNNRWYVLNDLFWFTKTQ